MYEYEVPGLLCKLRSGLRSRSGHLLGCYPVTHVLRRGKEARGSFDFKPSFFDFCARLETKWGELSYSPPNEGSHEMSDDGRAWTRSRSRPPTNTSTSTCIRVQNGKFPTRLAPPLLRVTRTCPKNSKYLHMYLKMQAEIC